MHLGMKLMPTYARREADICEEVPPPHLLEADQGPVSWV